MKLNPEVQGEVQSAYDLFRDTGEKKELEKLGIDIHRLNTHHDSIDFLLDQLGLPRKADSLKALCRDYGVGKVNPDAFDLIIYIASGNGNGGIPFTHIGIYDGEQVHTIWEPGYVAVHGITKVPLDFGELVLIRELKPVYRKKLQPQCYE